MKNMQEMDPEEESMKKRLNKAIAKDVTGEEAEEPEAEEKAEGPAGEIKEALSAAYASGMTADELHQMVSECCKGKMS